MKRVIVELARVLLSFTLVLSSFLKAIDPVGFSLKLEEYFDTLVGIHPSADLLLICSLTIISFEFILGSCLALGIYRRLSARISFLLFFMMTALTAYNYFFDAISDCGCFGDAIKLTNLSTLLKNLVLLPLSFYVLRVARKIKPLYTIRERVLLLLLSFMCIAFFMKGNLSQLPWLDFRPYQVGYNLREKIQEEDAALQEKLISRTKYVYRKEGREECFSADALPDSTWSFVSVKQDEDIAKLKRTYNFVIFDVLGNEVQERILSSSKLNILLFAPSWANAPQNKVDDLNHLYHLAKQRGDCFYAISNSNPEEAKDWLYETGADYPLFTMDKTVIKTIIRSSLGLVLIKDGKIIDKLSYQQVPNREEQTEFLKESHELAQFSKKSKDFRLIPLIVWLIILIFGFGRRLLRHGFAFSYLRRKFNHK